MMFSKSIVQIENVRARESNESHVWCVHWKMFAFVVVDDDVIHGEQLPMWNLLLQILLFYGPFSNSVRFRLFQIQDSMRRLCKHVNMNNSLFYSVLLCIFHLTFSIQPVMVFFKCWYQLHFKDSRDWRKNKQTNVDENAECGMNSKLATQPLLRWWYCMVEMRNLHKQIDKTKECRQQA